MVFNSVSFALFFPIAATVFFILPAKAVIYRKIWLLLCSYYFYATMGMTGVILLLISTLLSYIPSRLFCKVPEGGRKLLYITAVILELSLLFFFKYFDFFCDNLGIETGLNIILPVGISFYIFKSVSYITDVYRGTVEAEKDPLNHALYIAYFPELLSGPISRSSDIIPCFDNTPDPDYKRIRKGLLRMLTGLFIKLVIASRLAILVDNAYNSLPDAGALTMLTAALIFPVQIYCDFMSYTEIAIGAGEVFGIYSTENFRQPFLATDLSELWRRWHISLMNWFRDYLYIPLGGSRKGTLRKYLNIIIVFTVSGLWHGAAWTYIAWGFLSGLLQCLGTVSKDFRGRLLQLFPLHNGFTVTVHRIYKRAMTFFLFSFTAVFFRAATLQDAVTVITKIFYSFTPEEISTFDPTALGLGTFNLCIAVLVTALLVGIEVLKEKKGDIYALVTDSKWHIRWAVYFFLSYAIVLSSNIGAAKFIYFAF